MKTFTFNGVRAGWVTARVGSQGDYQSFVGSYVLGDAIRDLADNIASLGTISTATCRWFQEPEEIEWRFTRSDNSVKVTVLSCCERNAPPAQQLFEGVFEWPRFGADVLEALLELRSTFGLPGYECEWRHPFPAEACQKLEITVARASQSDSTLYQ